MANKKKRKQRNRQRTSSSTAWSSGTPPVETEAGAISSPRPAATAAPAASSSRATTAATPNYASGISGPRRAQGGPAGGAATIDIDARVPYFSSDLRRVLITAGVMIALIVVGSLLIK